MANLGIGGTFTVNTVEDGEDAQYIYLRGTAHDITDEAQTIPCIISVTGGNNVATHVRGLNLVTINRQTLQVVGEPLYYDTYGESVDIPDRYNNGITELISKLNSLDDSVFVCLVSFDAIGWVRLTDMAAGTYPLITALQGYGMSDIQFTQTGRYPFLFIGYKNLGKGNGLTRMRNTGNYYDYVETSVYVANGALTMRDGKDGTDGENAFDVTLDNQIAGVECDKNGDIVDDINIPFRISAHYGSNDVTNTCTITDNHEDVDYDIDVSYNQQQKGLVTLSLYGGNALRDTNVIAFTVVHPQYGTRIVSFTVKRIINGESAPFYNEEWYAWSNDTATASVTTAPTISGNWSTFIPSQGSYAYLWKKIVRHVWDEDTRTYTQETAQYFRMSGTNGTSIRTKGSVDYQNSSQGSGTALNLISNPSDGDAYVVGLDLQGNTGWLYQWVTESNSWIPLGQFKGESGVTYYTHIAWATNVVLSQSSLPKPAGQQNIPNATSVSGGAIVPSGADLPWMGYLIDTNVSDSTTFTNYTWSKTKGAKGEDAVAYEIQTSVESVKIPSNQSSTSRSITFRFYSKEGQSDRQAFTTYYSIYYRNVNNAYILVYPPTSFARSSYTYTFSNIGTSVSAIVVYIWGNTDYRGNFPEGQTYLAKKEISILKDGNDGQAGERGALGRSYYYAGEFNSEDESKHYVVNDAQCPFFLHIESWQKRYHVFNPTESPQSGNMTMAEMWEASDGDWNNAPWEVMNNDFKYLISEAVFADFAKFASFVISGDFLFSLQGHWIDDRYKDGATLISYYIFSLTGSSGERYAPAYTFINSQDTSIDKIAEFENISEAGTSVTQKDIVQDAIELEVGKIYNITWTSLTNCRIRLEDINGNVCGLSIISNGQCFQVAVTGYYYVVAYAINTSQSIGFTNVSLYQRYFSPNVCINGNTGKATMNQFKGAASLKQLFVGKGDNNEGSGEANLSGVTYIRQPIFYPDRDTGSSAQDVPNINTLPQIPLCKYVEVIKVNSYGQEVPDSAGKFYIDDNGYLRYTPILYDNLSVLRPRS